MSHVHDVDGVVRMMTVVDQNADPQMLAWCLSIRQRTIRIAFQSSLRNYSEFFSRVVGFFLVDDYLRHTMPGAAASGESDAAAAASYYQSYLADLWGTLVPRLTKIIARNASGCTTTGELLSLKHHCVLFERTMVNLGFHTAGLNEMLESVRRQFSHLLIDQWRNR